MAEILNGIMNHMKAAVCSHYGPADVVTVQDVPRPQPKANEVLVKVYSTAVTAADSRIRAARFPKGFTVFARLAFGVAKPRQKVLGSCFSGVVEAVGPKATEFAIGEEVCGMTGIKMGAHAEYIVVRCDKAIVKKPARISHDDAAAMMFGGTAALFFLRDKAKVAGGNKVLINGASGAVGTNAVQIAKYLGGEVTAVTSADNEELVRSIGADRVIDYTKTQLVGLEDKFDVILDAVGNIDIKSGVSLLNSDGRLALMVASLSQMFASARYKQVVTGTAAERKEDIAFLLGLMEERKLMAVIDSAYSLDDIAQAHARADGGNKKGNIVIKVA